MKKWSRSDEAILKAMYGHISTKKLSELFYRPIGDIYNMAFKLNLKKDHYFRKGNIVKLNDDKFK